MKKIFLAIFLSILLTTFALAATYDYSGSTDAGNVKAQTTTNADGTTTTTVTTSQGTAVFNADASGQTATATVTSADGTQVVNVDSRDGTVKVTRNGEEVSVMNSNGRATLTSGNVQVKSDGVDVSVQDGKVNVKLSNGNNAEVKVMPSTASANAIAKLQLHACTTDNGCTITLKETGSGSDASVVYEVKATKKVKVLGIFSADEDVSAEVDADAGTVTTHGPWWSFLASNAETSTSVSVK